MSSMYDWPSESSDERQLRQEKNALEKKLEIVEAGLSAALVVIIEQVKLKYGDRTSWEHAYELLDLREYNVDKEDIAKWHKQRWYELSRAKQRLINEANRKKEEEQKKMLIGSAAAKLTEEERQALGLHNMATAPTTIASNPHRLDGMPAHEVLKTMGHS